MSRKRNIITNMLEKVILLVTIKLNMKAMVIEIKHYHLKNTSIKLDVT